MLFGYGQRQFLAPACDPESVVGTSSESYPQFITCNPRGVSGVVVYVDHRQRRFTEYQFATLTVLSGILTFRQLPSLGAICKCLRLPDSKHIACSFPDIHHPSLLPSSLALSSPPLPAPPFLTMSPELLAWVFYFMPKQKEKGGRIAPLRLLKCVWLITGDPHGTVDRIQTLSRVSPERGRGPVRGVETARPLRHRTSLGPSSLSLAASRRGLRTRLGPCDGSSEGRHAAVKLSPGRIPRAGAPHLRSASAVHSPIHRSLSQSVGAPRRGRDERCPGRADAPRGTRRGTCGAGAEARQKLSLHRLARASQGSRFRLRRTDYFLVVTYAPLPTSLPERNCQAPVRGIAQFLFYIKEPHRSGAQVILNVSYSPCKEAIICSATVNPPLMNSLILAGSPSSTT